VKRVLEPEVMDGAAQARAGRGVDLGCGPADIPLRLVRHAPGASVLAVDASRAMLRLARFAAGAVPDGGRVRLVCARLPELPLPDGWFDVVISNSLVHHLPDPSIFWREARRVARRGAAVHIMDLFRPDSVKRARAIVEAAAADADPILKEDFFNSLLAALTPGEVRAQLDAAGLEHLACDVVSERHWLVSERL
jgi:ubiquinone/menaquinone biosynthesis C-methylase UbiE